jgi:NTE family protein
MNNSDIKLKRKISKLLLCGGGFKFYYIYGSIKYLYEINVINSITEFIGISAGGILSLLFSIGYSPDELNKFIMEFKFDRLIDPHIDNLLENRGLDNGDILKAAIQKLLMNKKFSNEITLKELFEKTNKKLVLVASNITKNVLESIDYNTHPDMPVWQGILITCALPILFEPILYKGNYLIDGGVFDNYPVELFVSDDIIGVNLSAHSKDIDFNIDFFNYMTKLFAISHHWKNVNKIDKYRKYTIEIKTYDNTELLNSEISIDEKNRRILYGYDSAETHFKIYEIDEKPAPVPASEVTTEEVIEKVSQVNYII